MSRSSDVFPAPLGPTRKWKLPASIVRSRFAQHLLAGGVAHGGVLQLEYGRRGVAQARLGPRVARMSPLGTPGIIVYHGINLNGNTQAKQTVRWSG